MKIVFVTSTMAVGGVETNLVGLGAELSVRGHDVTVVSSGGALVAELERQGIRHVTTPIVLRDPLGLMRSAWVLRLHVARHRPEIVHAMSAAATLVCATLPDGALRISSPMGLQNSDREPTWVTMLRNCLMTVRVHWILIISEEIGRAIRSLGISDGRLVECDVVGIDADRFRASTALEGSAVRRELRIPEGAPLVTTIGALHRRKSHDLFLAAAAAVRRHVPGARFLIIGEGSERSALTEQVRRLGLYDVATMPGARRDISAILAATDVYVKPGIVEGFIGITVLEAQAAGRPVVAFDTRDVRAAITDQETGLLVPRGDTDALASAIVALIGDGERAAALGERGRQAAIGRFSLSAVAERLERTYSDLRARTCA